jgi:hypothetical protein
MRSSVKPGHHDLLHAMKKKLGEKEIDYIYNKCRNATSHKIQDVGVTVV